MTVRLCWGENEELLKHAFANKFILFLLPCTKFLQRFMSYKTDTRARFIFGIYRFGSNSLEDKPISNDTVTALFLRLTARLTGDYVQVNRSNCREKCWREPNPKSLNTTVDRPQVMRMMSRAVLARESVCSWFDAVHYLRVNQLRTRNSLRDLHFPSLSCLQ